MVFQEQLQLPARTHSTLLQNYYSQLVDIAVAILVELTHT